MNFYQAYGFKIQPKIIVHKQTLLRGSSDTKSMIWLFWKGIQLLIK